MAKAEPLTPAALSIPQITPQAATAGRGGQPLPKSARPPKVEQVLPLQLRLPRSQVRAIKIAAAEREQTLSDFMLACFHAVMAAAKPHDV